MTLEQGYGNDPARCAIIRSHFSSYLDGVLSGLTMQDIAEMDGWMQRSNPVPDLRKPIITGARPD